MSSWRRPDLWLYRILQGLAGLLIAAALLISLGRALLPQIDTQRQWLEAELSAALGRPFSVASISGLWRRGPQIELRDLAISGDDGQALRADRVLLGVDLWHSLAERRLQLRHVELEGLHLFIAPQHSDTSNNDELLELLFGTDLTISVRDTTLHLRRPGQPPQQLTLASLAWQHRDGQIIASGELLGDDDGNEQALLQFRGQRQGQHSLSGQLYLQLERLDLARLWPQAAASGLHSALFAELWLKVDQLQIKDLQLRMRPSRLWWQQGDERHNELGLSQGLGRWQQQAGNWQLSLRDWHGDYQGERWAMPLLAAAQQQQQQRLYLQQLPLPLLGWLAPLNGKPLADIDRWQLAGQLGPLWAGARHGDDAASDLWLTGQFQQLGWQPQPSLPGAQGLDGTFWLAQGAGGAQIHGHDARLLAGDHFIRDIPLGRLELPLALRQQQGQWRLATQGAQIHAKDLSARISAALNLGEQPQLQLFAEVDLADAASAPSYYPLQAMPAEVSDYLSQSLLGGSVKGAQILWHGPLAQFPFSGHDGHFSASVPLRGATLRFDEGWPALTNLDLELLFEDDDLWMSAGQGQIGANQVAQLNASIAPLDGSAPLIINSQIKGSGSAISKVFNQSPLADSLGATLNQLPIGGNVNGQLQLTIPLYADAEVTATGEARFAGNSLKIQALGLELGKLQGTLAFNNSQLKARQLKARYRGQQLTLNLDGHEQGDHYQLALDWRGRGPLAELANLNGSDGLPLLAGNLDWQARLKATLGATHSFNFTASSDLAAASSRLPYPLHKSAGPAQPFTLTVQGQGENLSARFDMPGLAQGQAKANGSQLQALALSLGDATLPPLEPGVVNLAANADNLAIDEWLALRPLLASSDTGEALRLGYMQLRANQFSGWGLSLGPASLELFANGEGYALELGGADNSLGALIGEQIQIHGEQLTLRRLISAEAVVPPPPTAASALPTILPIALDINQLQLDTWALGQVKASIQPWADGRRGMQIERLLLRPNNGELTARGGWQVKGDGVDSWLDGRLATADIGALADEVGIGGGMRQAQLQVTGRLNWPGALWDFSRQRLNGQLRLDGKDGVLADVGGTGSRFLGILSFQSLLRKLRLDFNDLFAKGYLFDSLSGNFSINHGVASTTDLHLNGPSMAISLQGETDLATEAIDYEVLVLPKLTSSLPVLTAFAITPVTGLYVFALSKVLEPVVEVVSEVKLVVAGSIDEPVVAEVGRSQRTLNPAEWQALLPSALQAAQANQPPAPAAKPKAAKPARRAASESATERRPATRAQDNAPLPPPITAPTHQAAEPEPR